MWQEIRGQADIDAFLEQTGWLHDSCITGAGYISGAHVDAQGAMQVQNTSRTLLVRLDQQGHGERIRWELRFEGVELVVLQPGGDGLMLDCSLELRDGWLCWSDSDGTDWSAPLAVPPAGRCVRVIARRMSWRRK